MLPSLTVFYRSPPAIDAREQNNQPANNLSALQHQLHCEWSNKRCSRPTNSSIAFSTAILAQQQQQQPKTYKQTKTDRCSSLATSRLACQSRLSAGKQWRFRCKYFQHNKSVPNYYCIYRCFEMDWKGNCPSTNRRGANGAIGKAQRLRVIIQIEIDFCNLIIMIRFLCANRNRNVQASNIELKVK